MRGSIYINISKKMKMKKSGIKHNIKNNNNTHHNKKAASESFAALLLFTTLIVASLTVIINFQEFTISTQNTIDESEKFVEKKIQTKLTYISVSYNSVLNQFEIVLENSGSTSLTTSKFSHFVDDIFFSNITMYSNATKINTQTLIRPGEHVYFELPMSITSGSFKTIKSVSEYGVSIEEKYDI